MDTPKNWNGCGNCKHLRSSAKRGYYCKAFPEHIPLAFSSGGIPHTTVTDSQVGTTVWEEKK